MYCVLSTNVGYKSLNDIIGKGSVIEMRKDVHVKKTQGVALDFLFDNLYCVPDGENACELDENANLLENRCGPLSIIFRVACACHLPALIYSCLLHT